MYVHLPSNLLSDTNLLQSYHNNIVKFFSHIDHIHYLPLKMASNFVHVIYRVPRPRSQDVYMYNAASFPTWSMPA